MDQLAASGLPGAVFEANGGFLLGSRIDSSRGSLAPLPTRDAALPVLAVLAAARGADTPVSALAANLPSRHTASDRLQEMPVQLSRELLARFGREPTTLLALAGLGAQERSEEHTSELQSLMRISYAVFCLKKQNKQNKEKHKTR